MKRKVKITHKLTKQKQSLCDFLLAFYFMWVCVYMFPYQRAKEVLAVFLALEAFSVFLSRESFQCILVLAMSNLPVANFILY